MPSAGWWRVCPCSLGVLGNSAQCGQVEGVPCSLGVLEESAQCRQVEGMCVCPCSLGVHKPTSFSINHNFLVVVTTLLISSKLKSSNCHYNLRTPLDWQQCSWSHDLLVVMIP